MRTLLAPLLLAFLASQAFGCTTKTVIKSQPAAQEPSPEENLDLDDESELDDVTTTEIEAETFGDPINPKTPEVSLADVLADPEAYRNKTITTFGVVRQVCQKRGCWAEIRPEEARESETMRVTFQGYAFFLPKDSRGANVKIEGRVSVQLLSPEEVTYHESEGATFTNKREDGSAISTMFVASGVEMTNRKK